MITIKFFSSLRETLGIESYVLDESDIGTVDQLIFILSQQSPEWAEALSANNLLIAVNKVYSARHCLVPNNAEVGIFPPVTGG